MRIVVVGKRDVLGRVVRPVAVAARALPSTSSSIPGSSFLSESSATSRAPLVSDGRSAVLSSAATATLPSSQTAHLFTSRPTVSPSGLPVGASPRKLLCTEGRHAQPPRRPPPIVPVRPVVVRSAGRALRTRSVVIRVPPAVIPSLPVLTPSVPPELCRLEQSLQADAGAAANNSATFTLPTSLCCVPPNVLLDARSTLPPVGVQAIVSGSSLPTIGRGVHLATDLVAPRKEFVPVGVTTSGLSVATGVSATVASRPLHSARVTGACRSLLSTRLQNKKRLSAGPAGVLTKFGSSLTPVVVDTAAWQPFAVAAEVRVSSSHPPLVEAASCPLSAVSSATVIAPTVLAALRAPFDVGHAAIAISDPPTSQALKDSADAVSAHVSRAVKHAEIRPVLDRKVSALSTEVYQRLLACRLDLKLVPTPEKALRERIRRLLKQGVKVDTVFNIVSGGEELRLLDSRGRIIVKHEEVEDCLNFFWDDGFKMDTNHTLRRKIAARFAGIGGKKVEMFLAQKVSTSVRNFPVPYTAHPRHVLASRPMEHIQIDCTHLYSVTYRGSVVTGLISFIDLFSKFIFACPIIAECTWEVCQAFIFYCSVFGAPEIVQTDHGTAFMGDMTAMAEQFYGCKVIHGRVRYPESQASVEKNHLKLKNKIVGLAFEYFKDIHRWPEMVPMGLRLANNSPYAGFNEELSPFTVFYGRADNQPLAADIELLNGTYIQKTARLQTLEQKKMARLAGQIDIDHYVAGDKVYNVDLCFRPTEERQLSENDRAYEAAGEAAQELVDRRLASSTAVAADLRVGYTSTGLHLLRESGTIIRESLEFHRMAAESLLRKQLPSGQHVQDLTTALRDLSAGESSVDDALQMFARFSSGIREGAAQFMVAYIESVDAGTRKRMPTPYQQNDGVWVLSLAEHSVLCRKYRSMWTTATDRRLKKRLPGVIRSIDSQSINRPYEVEIFVDGEAAMADDRSVCEIAWLSGASLAPQTGLLRKIRRHGNLRQVPGLCVERTSPALFCLRRAPKTCTRSLCELHCAAVVGGTCGTHRNSKLELYAITE